MDNKLLNFGLKCFALFKRDTQVRIAIFVLFSGITLLTTGGPILVYLLQQLVVSKGEISISLQQTSDAVMYLGYLLTLVGLGLCIYKFVNANKANMSILYLGANIHGTTQDEAIKYIPAFEKSFCIPRPLDRIDTYNKNKVIDDYKYNQKTFRTHIEHIGAKYIYVAALGSFPYLFLLGSLLRNGYRKVSIMDFDRGRNEWYSLPVFGKNAYNILDANNCQQEETIENAISQLKNSESGEVGIALSYTFEIQKDTIPKHLQDKTLYLKNSLGVGHDLLANQTSQNDLLKELSTYIEKLSRNKKVCLFVSAQASFCINMGRTYMDNSHGTIVLYNYKRKEGHNWSIEFNNDVINT